MQAHLVEVDALLSRGDLSATADLLAKIAALAPDDQRIVAPRQRLDQAIAAREAEEAHARAREEKQAEAEALFAAGDLDGALRLIKAAQTLGGDQPETALLYERVVQAIRVKEEAEALVRRQQMIADLLTAAEQRLNASDRKPGDLSAAVQEIDRPSHCPPSTRLASR